MLDFSEGGKHVQTRDGREVTILTTMARGIRPVCGLIRCATSDEVQSWRSNGRIYVESGFSPLDLVPYTPTDTYQFTVPAGCEVVECYYVENGILKSAAMSKVGG